MGGGLSRWLKHTRQHTVKQLQAAQVRAVRAVVPSSHPAEPGRSQDERSASAKRPVGKGKERSLLERVPAPRGLDALHELAWHAGNSWFGDAISDKQTLAQRATEVLSGLGPLQLPARQVDDGQPGGLHRSLRRGGGVEFSEHKEYSPGDDLRHMDWKAYGRTDRYYIKRYEQEVHAALTLVVDASASMAFADLRGGDKFDAVRLLLATLALILVRQGDSVGLVVIGHPELQVASGTGVRHFSNLCARLESIRPSGQAGVDALTPAQWRHGETHGLAVVASDVLVSPHKALNPLQEFASAGLDVLLLHTLHPRERDLDFAGPTQFHCPETQAHQLTDPRLVKQQYAQLMAKHCEELRIHAAHAGIGYLAVDTSIDARGVMRQILRATARLKRRGQAPAAVGAYGEIGFDSEALLAHEGAGAST